MAYGVLYGIGVGPGSPDLLTLRAVSVLQSVDCIFAASSSKNEYSVALNIVKPHLRAETPLVSLDFPMTRDTALLQAAWKKNAEQVAVHLQKGLSAAFITLGDPLIYSTFGYLLTTLKELYADIPVEIVPGITSYQAAAASTQTILCQGTESLLLLSGICQAETTGKELAKADSVVVLKTYKNFADIRRNIPQERLKSAVFASRLGHAEECVCAAAQAPENPHYLSLLLLPNKRK